MNTLNARVSQKLDTELGIKKSIDRMILKKKTKRNLSKESLHDKRNVHFSRIFADMRRMCIHDGENATITIGNGICFAFY